MSLQTNDDDGDDGLFLALVVAGVYFLYQFWRDRAAAAYGGGYFQPAPPAYDPTEGILNILIPLQLSPAGRDFIKQNEGFRANPYPDGKGHSSIGYGHQIQPGENIVPPISTAEAESLFAGDVAAAEKTVSNALLVQVSQNQFDSLVDFAFNVGAGAFLGSTLLQELNQGDFSGAAGQFTQWEKSGGAARRQAETNLFAGG